MVGMEVLTGGAPRPDNENYMKRLLSSLKPKGKLVIIDFLPGGGRPHVPPEFAVKKMQGYGYKLAGRRDLAIAPDPMYVLTFVRR